MINDHIRVVYVVKEVVSFQGLSHVIEHALELYRPAGRELHRLTNGCIS